MHAPDSEFDPDDNYAGGFDPDLEIDEDAGSEALVWQLLLLLNPGDEETALQQFAAYQEATADADEDEFEPAWVLKDIIDWKSGFQVHDDDAAAFVESITELVSRWNLDLDWGVEDPTDDEFLADASIADLLHVAYDALRAYGYTLWVWETGTDTVAGWIALSRDDDAMRAIAPAIGIELRPGGLA
ncbi:hypothetical protein [Luteimonas sp. MC1825]|uniref:DUF6630 family protein n=1 Tax=Luteimonas sp. MC1825 TaxID=2761107 RepID=UPI001616B3E8|nr:hypothetical protein [Luteimonas sp. MC1825]MBB6599717.1 hypothetical protein [Luteimonas sp. MC1825]QOC87399.1 hypothetical protein IDM46_08960 [Luteimonas sp. MC1825]